MPRTLANPLIDQLNTERDELKKQALEIEDHFKAINVSEIAKASASSGDMINRVISYVLSLWPTKEIP